VPGLRLADLAVLEGTRNQLRLERLAAWLRERGPLAVRDTVVRRHGDRVALYLDDDSVLRLKMFWPRPQIVAALMSVRWARRIGWVVVVRTTAGEEIVDYAWLATLTPLDPSTT
jgi:hypothetical protein